MTDLAKAMKTKEKKVYQTINIEKQYVDKIRGIAKDGGLTYSEVIAQLFEFAKKYLEECADGRDNV